MLKQIGKNRRDICIVLIGGWALTVLAVIGAALMSPIDVGDAGIIITGVTGSVMPVLAGMVKSEDDQMGDEDKEEKSGA